MNRQVVTALAISTVLTVAAVSFLVAQRDPLAAAAIGDGAAPGSDLATIAGPAVEGATDLGATTTEVITLDQTGIVNVTYTLRWTAGAGSDTMRLAIAPSAGTGVMEGAISEEENDGEITLTIAVPNTAANGQLGVGEWEATVEFVDAQAATPVQPPVYPPGARDTNVAWTLETSLQTLSG